MKNETFNRQPSLGKLYGIFHWKDTEDYLSFHNLRIRNWLNTKKLNSVFLFAGYPTVNMY